MHRAVLTGADERAGGKEDFISYPRTQCYLSRHCRHVSLVPIGRSGLTLSRRLPFENRSRHWYGRWKTALRNSVSSMS